MEGLLLTGMAAGALLAAATSLLMITSREALQSILFWLLGSLTAARWHDVGLLAPYAGIGLLAALALARDMDALLWGEDASRSLGVHVLRTRRLLLLVASLLAAASVAVAGIVGFVGLMVPHLARFVVGSSHRRVLPLAFVIGGLLLLWADIVARCVWAPAELPLGAITAVLGAPFLIYLCNRRRA